MRFIQKTDNAKIKALPKTKGRNAKLGAWACIQVEDMLSKRFWLDEEWRIALRQYEAIPEMSGRNRPYTEQIVLEIPIGAKQCDTIVSAMEDLIFQASPVFTVRGSPGWESHAFAAQLLSDKLLLDAFTNFRMAARELMTDTVQMGTGIASVIRSEEVSKHATFDVIDRGPRCYSIPPEDYVVPGGAYAEIDSMSVTGYRVYYTEAELREAANQNNWNIDGFKPAGNVSWVRQRREHVELTDEATDNLGRLYEVFHLYGYYDYNDDGFAEDLYFVYDRTGKSIGYVSYAPYDTRPIVVARYQLRPHVFYGLGVMKMARPFQMEVSEWHNFKMANAHLSNTRFWAYKLGAVGLGEDLQIGPNKSIGLQDPKNDLEAKTMADMYTSAQQYEAVTLQMADQRVGVNELGGGPIQAGKRVPAATAMSILQQQNKRFAAPFNNVREACADMMRHCILRMREQWLKGGKNRRQVIEFMVKSIGPKNSLLMEQLFGAESNDIRDYISIEVTASSASINRESDRQSAMALVQILGGYYEKILQLSQIFLNPQLPEPMKKLALEIAKASALAVERLLRTFDNVRDPNQYIPETIRKLNEPEDLGNANPAGGPTEGIPGSPQGASENPEGDVPSDVVGPRGQYDVGPAPATEGQLTGATPTE